MDTTNKLLAAILLVLVLMLGTWIHGLYFYAMPDDAEDTGEMSHELGCITDSECEGVEA